MTTRRIAIVVGAAAAVVAAAWLWPPQSPTSDAIASDPTSPASSAPERRGEPARSNAATSLGSASAWPSDPLRWLAAAGGATPELNQISIAQDLALVADVLGPGGRVLFGAGPGSPSVQVLDADATRDPTAAALADLLAPRAGRDATYRSADSDLRIDDAATKDTLLAALRRAAATGDDPLLLWIGGHGLPGQTPRDNVVSLWAQGDLTVAELAEVIDEASRPVIIVATTCFSGGLGELVFAGADESRGAASTPRCGLFAAPWDLEASGCDPDPDRAAHEGYAIHWAHALRGQDRTGTALPTDAIDVDGDGRISLLEAHTRVRIAAPTADVPTTTAERWLRHAAPATGRTTAVELPEESAVITALAKKLDLIGREDQAAPHVERIEATIDGLAQSLDEAAATEDARYRAAAAELLARWPVLDDPWHPEFAVTLTNAHDDIAAFFATSSTYAAWMQARERTVAIDREIWQLRTQAAPFERLARARETIAIAGRLRAAGGRAWDTYAALLACERHVLADR